MSVKRKSLATVFSSANDGTNRNVLMTEKCKAEFDGIGDVRTRAFLRATMGKFARAITSQDEPREKKFKRLGRHPTGGKCGERVICEFKKDVYRIYGVEEVVDGVASIILTLASSSGKGGAGGRQHIDIRTAAERFGSWYDGK
ncbi:hypothetical protein [Dongia rigui]|uniref:Uncharacterized protein n=1 Tax=Dongia rigui TaxID=940149 RepID=A0ABU5E196_9PROT|nr:hypothetical protein [Dongia rigui]MDY0873117.1 hypothetical protein [Dongia rigui]